MNHIKAFYVFQEENARKTRLIFNPQKEKYSKRQVIYNSIIKKELK
jgi:hypothetical protein